MKIRRWIELITYSKILKLQDIKPILASQYEEHTASKMNTKVKGYIKKISDYFSD